MEQLVSIVGLLLSWLFFLPNSRLAGIESIARRLHTGRIQVPSREKMRLESLERTRNGISLSSLAISSTNNGERFSG